VVEILHRIAEASSFSLALTNSAWKFLSKAVAKLPPSPPFDGAKIAQTLLSEASLSFSRLEADAQVGVSFSSSANFERVMKLHSGAL
jgi:hypothetical protein